MMNDKQSNFLKERRIVNDLTQHEIAEMIGVSEKTYHNWENGKSRIYVEKVPALCKVLNITVDEFYACKMLNDEEKEVAETVRDNITEIKDIEKNRIKRILLTIIMFLVCYLSGTFVFDLINDNEYDRCYQHELSSSDERFDIKGTLTLTEEKKIIYIDDVKVKDSTLNIKDVYDIDYDLVINDAYIFKQSGLKNTYNKYLYSFGELVENEMKITAVQNIETDNFSKNSYKKVKLLLTIRYLDTDMKINDIEIPVNLKEADDEEVTYYMSDNGF